MVYLNLDELCAAVLTLPRYGRCFSCLRQLHEFPSAIVVAECFLIVSSLLKLIFEGVEWNVHIVLIFLRHGLELVNIGADLLGLLSTVIAFRREDVKFGHLEFLLFPSILLRHSIGDTTLLLPVRGQLVLTEVGLWLPVLATDILIAPGTFLNLLNLELEASATSLPLPVFVDDQRGLR